MQASLAMTYSILLLTHCSYLAAAGALSPTDSLPAAGRPYTTKTLNQEENYQKYSVQLQKARHIITYYYHIVTYYHIIT